MRRSVVMFSGGLGSWAAARRAGPNPLLVFADTKMEDPGLYEFVEAAAADVGGELVTLADGRNPWEVFRDVRFIGNTRADPCSRILKRDLIRKWLEENHDPADVSIVLGIDWTEEHRLRRARPHWEPYELLAPLVDPPYLSKRDLAAEARDRGLPVPPLYALGFPHNNCGGFCIKAGHGQFKMLLATMPDRFRFHEDQEEALRQSLGKDVSILRDRRGGETRPMTLREFRERVEADTIEVDMFDLGGCGCMVDIEEDVPGLTKP